MLFSSAWNFLNFIAVEKAIVFVSGYTAADLLWLLL